MNEKSEFKTQKDDIPTLALKKQGKFLPVWIVPVIAAGIGIWLLAQAVINSGIPIVITFVNGADIDSRTQIKYEGIVVGQVNSIKLNKQLDGVVVKAKLDRSASGLACEGSKFWVVRPEISLDRIAGLETIMSGSYIAVQAGQGPAKKSFKGLERPPLNSKNKIGLRIIVKSDKLASIKEGVPVYYREVQVGEVEGYSLAETGETVDIKVNIFEPYKEFVHENSMFWNASGIGMQVGLFGAKIRTESLAALLKGGVAFAIPDNNNMGPVSENGAVFTLHEKPKDEWLKWSPDLSLDETGKTETDIKTGSGNIHAGKNYDF